MKKTMMVLALIASMIVSASTDIYTFKSTMKVYSLKKQAYVSTTFKGTLTVDSETGEATIAATKKDTKEKFELYPADGASTNSVIESFAIVAGKKNKVGAAYFAFEDEDGRIHIEYAGAGAAKTVTTGCGPCGGATACTKLTSLSGSFRGWYECGCENGQYYLYDGTCELPEDKDGTACPIYGSWSAKLKTVDGKKFK